MTPHLGGGGGAPSEAAANHALARWTEMRTKVLVFEHDADFADDLRLGLTRLGCQVTVVDDANAGLSLAAELPPDLIILSIELPRVNGYSVCNKLRHDPKLKLVPLLIVSSESSEETFERHRRLRTRADGYFQKPSQIDALLREVNDRVTASPSSGRVAADAGATTTTPIASHSGAPPAANDPHVDPSPASMARKSPPHARSALPQLLRPVAVPRPSASVDAAPSSASVTGASKACEGSAHGEDASAPPPPVTAGAQALSAPPCLLICANCGTQGPDDAPCAKCGFQPEQLPATRFVPSRRRTRPNPDHLAADLGVELPTIAPSLTSRSCPNCGEQGPSERPCAKCGLDSPRVPARPKRVVTNVGMLRRGPVGTLDAGAGPPVTAPSASAARSAADLPPPASAAASIVVWSSPQATQVGRRHVVPDFPLGLGRDAQHEIVLDGDEQVSADHCRFVRADGVVFVEDRGSTNGTLLGDVTVTRAALHPGDVLRVGQTLLKFIDGSDVEYHRAVDEMVSRDALTGLTNPRVFLEHTALEVRRATESSAPLSLVLVGIDGFASLVAAYGPVTADTVLTHVARALQEVAGRSGDLARHAGAVFALLLPATPRWTAIGVARRLVEVVSSAAGVVVGGERLRLTASAGVSLLRAPWTAEGLVEEAWRELATAAREGNAVSPAEFGPLAEKAVRHVLEGQWLLRRALGREHLGPLVAFELDEEANVVASVGVEGSRRWFRELVADVLKAADGEDLVGVWHERYVVVAVGDGPRSLIARRATKESRAGEIERRVAESWRARTPEGCSSGRALRSATLAVADLSACRERALDELVVRLLRRSTASWGGKAEPRMPFPLAVTSMIVETRTTAQGRVKALEWGLDVATRLVVAIEFAALRQRASPRFAEVAARPKGRLLTMGGWLELARGLSEVSLAEAVPRVVGQIAGRIVTSAGKPSELAQRLEQSVVRRNRLAWPTSTKSPHRRQLHFPIELSFATTRNEAVSAGFASGARGSVGGARAPGPTFEERRAA